MRRCSAMIVLLLALGGCVSSAPRATTSAIASAPRDPAVQCFKPRSGPIAIDSEAMERLAEGKRVVFTGGVVACLAKTVQYADRLEVFLDDTREAIVRIVATGHVRVRTRDCLQAAAQRTVYDWRHDQLILSGGVRVVDSGVGARYERFVIYLSLVPLTPARCGGARDVRRRRLLVVAGERRGDAEADVHAAGDPALAGQEARAGPQPARRGAGAQRVEPVGHQPQSDEYQPEHEDLRAHAAAGDVDELRQERQEEE